MPLDLPDFTKRISLDVNVQGALVKEWLTSVCGIRSIDTTGRIEFIENFGNGLERWELVIDGLGAGAIVLSSQYYSSAGYSCQMSSGDDPEEVDIVLWRPPQTGGKWGFEFKAGRVPGGGIVIANVAFLAAPINIWGWVKWDFNVNKIYLRNADSVWEELGDIVNPSGDRAVAFDVFKVVIDTDSHEYIRVVFNEQSFLNTGILCAETVDPLAKYWWYRIFNGYNGEGGSTVWVDDVIITSDDV